MIEFGNLCRLRNLLELLGNMVGKKSFFPILFCFLIFGKCFGQTNVYHPFSPEHAMWSVLLEEYYNEAQFFTYTLYKTEYGGDSIIAGKKYFRLVTYNGRSPEYKDTCYLRDDTINKKIYLYDQSLTDGIDSLLYDFSVIEGASLSHTLAFTMYPDAHVKSIDSVLIGDTYRKRFNIEFTAEYFADPWLGEDTLINTFWIEGIGSENGPVMNNGSAQYTPPTQYFLLCYGEFSDYLYIKPSEFADCDSTFFYYSVNNIINNLTLHIYPNPSTDFITIEITDNDMCNYIFELYDLNGRLIQNINLNPQKTIINISQLNSGFYISHIKTGKNLLYIGKVIIY